MRGVPIQESAARKAANEARKGVRTANQIAASAARKGISTTQSPAQKAATDKSRGVPKKQQAERTAKQQAASDARKGVPTGQSPAQKAATVKRRGAKTPVQIASAERREAAFLQREAARKAPEEVIAKINAYWAERQLQDLRLIWDDRNVIYDDDCANLPGVEDILALRTSSVGQDRIIQAQNGSLGQDILAPRIVQEHNEAQPQLPLHERTRIRAIWGLERFGRRSRDRIFNDCGPNAPNGRECPVDQEQRLFNTLQHIMQRGNKAIIFQRGVDGLTNSDSLELFLRY